jgi:hypothetical protein
MAAEVIESKRFSAQYLVIQAVIPAESVSLTYLLLSTESIVDAPDTNPMTLSPNFETTEK